MFSESITFQVNAEPDGPTLKLVHEINLSPTNPGGGIEWYKRVDGRWVRATGLDDRYKTFLPDDWAKVPDALLRAMGIES